MTMSMIDPREQDLTVGEDELYGLREQVAGDGPRLPLAGPVLDEQAAKRAARRAVADLVDERAMDAVLAQIKGDGLRLTGPGGFLSELVKSRSGTWVAGGVDRASGLSGARCGGEGFGEFP